MIDADVSWMVDAFASGYKFTIKLAVDTHQNQGIFYLNYFVLILNYGCHVNYFPVCVF